MNFWERCPTNGYKEKLLVFGSTNSATNKFLRSKNIIYISYKEKMELVESEVEEM